MRDWFEAHALRSLRGKSRTQATGAKKTNFLSWANIGLWYGALGIDPKLQHPSRTMKGAWRFSISRSAASHKAMYPVVMVCGMASLPRAPCWQNPSPRSTTAVEVCCLCKQYDGHRAEA
jgi:hypothetical protein